MKWEKALKESQKCPDCMPACIAATSDKVPSGDAEAVLLCKIKIRNGQLSDNCTLYDCPKDHVMLDPIY